MITCKETARLNAGGWRSTDGRDDVHLLRLYFTIAFKPLMVVGASVEFGSLVRCLGDCLAWVLIYLRCGQTTAGGKINSS